MSPDTHFSGLVQAFFTDRLLRQRGASPHTVAGYRDTFRLLLRFAKERLRKAPSKMSLKDLDLIFRRSPTQFPGIFLRAGRGATVARRSSGPGRAGERSRVAS